MKNNKETCISALKLAQQELGDYFSSVQYEKWRTADMPSLWHINKHFSTFNNAKLELKIPIFRHRYTSVDELVHDFHQSLKLLGYIPTSKEYEKLNMKPTLGTIRKFGLTFSKLVIMLGYKPIRIKNHTKEQVIKRISDYIISCGYMVSSREYNRDAAKLNMPSLFVLERVFGSFENAIQAAGGDTPSWNNEKIILALCKKFHNIPSYQEYVNTSRGCKDIPSHSTLRKYFKTLRNAFKEAGFNID